MQTNREETIRALYAAATGLGSWTEALAGLARLGHSQVVTLDTYDFDAHAGQVLAASVLPDPSIEAYNREFGYANFTIEAGRPRYRVGNVLRTSDFISQLELLESDLYQHVYRPMDIRHASGVALEATDFRIVEFSFMRATDAGEHSDRNIDRIRQLTPHMMQAWAGYSHLNQLKESLNTLTDLWDCVAHAVIVIDRHLKIEFANRAAETLLAAQSGWSDRFGRLHWCAGGGEAMLKQALTHIMERKGDVVSLTPPALAGACKPLVTLYRISEDRIAIVMTDSADAASDLQTALRARFDLTAAEADLINALIAGKSLHEIAEQREIHYETARAHLKNAMRKNAWCRQGQMISDVLRTLLPQGLLRP